MKPLDALPYLRQQISRNIDSETKYRPIAHILGIIFIPKRSIPTCFN